MKKISTATAQKVEKVEGERLTVGLDLGDRSRWYCVLNEAGRGSGTEAGDNTEGNEGSVRRDAAPRAPPSLVLPRSRNCDCRPDSCRSTRAEQPFHPSSRKSSRGRCSTPVSAHVPALRLGSVAPVPPDTGARSGLPAPPPLTARAGCGSPCWH